MIKICLDCKKEFNAPQICTVTCNACTVSGRSVYFHKKYVKWRCTKQEFIEQYKLNHPCGYCGESDPNCLQFHHINPVKKQFYISTYLRSHISYKRLQKELKRCIVLCANCHFKFHAKKRQQNVSTNKAGM